MDRSRHKRYSGILLLVLLCALNVACAPGSGEGLDLSGRPLSEGGDVPLGPNLASIQANVFNPSCIVCHAGAGAPQGLRLDAANSFTDLVGVPSRQASSVLRVSPGNPGQSYLIQKLEGSASAGDQMPLGGPPIPQATIDFVRQWITDGALPVSATVPSGTPPVVVSLTPEPDQVIPTFPAQIIAGFDQDIDASTVNAVTFGLLASGGDGSFSEGNEAPITATSVSLSGINARLAVMDLSGVSPLEDRFQVTLRGSGANIILNLDGVALDGNFTAQFEVRGIQATLQSIQDNVFTPICSSGCHTGPPGPSLPAGMDLSSAMASALSLVDIPSLEQPGILRVASGDAANSYLIQKVEGTALSGERMPLGGPFLDQATIDTIRTWIDQGAKP